MDSVVVCDLDRGKAEAYRDTFGTEIIDSLDAALADPTINTVALFTQRHTHGPLAAKALQQARSCCSLNFLSPRQRH